jgi:hypothetical protein
MCIWNINTYKFSKLEYVANIKFLNLIKKKSIEERRECDSFVVSD